MVLIEFTATPYDPTEELQRWQTNLQQKRRTYAHDRRAVERIDGYLAQLEEWLAARVI